MELNVVSCIFSGFVDVVTPLSQSRCPTHYVYAHGSQSLPNLYEVSTNDKNLDSSSAHQTEQSTSEEEIKSHKEESLPTTGMKTFCIEHTCINLLDIGGAVLEMPPYYDDDNEVSSKPNSCHSSQEEKAGGDQVSEVSRSKVHCQQSGKENGNNAKYLAVSKAVMLITS